ncbi:MAG: dienelactone hydrolase family protein, partial [Verrucomicrobiae bacterium]|nr:dienelactone hydrolase family protein [Verrucomicrobiae bacterium]
MKRSIHRNRFRAPWVAAAMLLSGGGLSPGAISEETVFFDLPEELEPSPIPAPTPAVAALAGYPNDPDQLTLAARLFLPDPAVHGDGPYPAVVVLHGSGGLWSSDIIANGLISQFEQWGEILAGLGYAALFPDSYNPRGIPGNFESKRPHHDPAIDDDLCSPNYERPKDVVAALAYLDGRADIDCENVALIGFSHGAQTGINAIDDISVDLGQYTVSYIGENGTTTKDVPSPVRIPENLPFPKLCAFFYGGGSHFGYHGSASSTAAGRYMFDRRTKVLMFHGTADSLMGVNDPDAVPMTGNLYPIKQALASRAQAQSLGLPDPLQHHYLMHEVGHSFDLE